MLSFNEKILRVELIHPHFANSAKVDQLKRSLAREKERFGATRAVLRVLTEKPFGDEQFELEAKIRVPGGNIAIFGFNDSSRFPSPDTVRQETAYLARVVGTQRRTASRDLEIRRLEANRRVAEELESLYADTYSDYPKPLTTTTILKLLQDSIPYAVFENGRMVSVLFGEITEFEDVHVIELTYSATVPLKRGIGMTVALANKIGEEAEYRFHKLGIFAETIAGPVMRSCHDFGMTYQGLLREHYRIAIGDRLFTNLYLWSF